MAHPDRLQAQEDILSDTKFIQKLRTQQYAQLSSGVEPQDVQVIVEMTDIDACCTGDTISGEALRKAWNQKGAATACNTSRTVEMTMNQEAYDASVAASALRRPEAHLGKRKVVDPVTGGQSTEYFATDPSTLRDFLHVIDFDTSITQTGGSLHNLYTDGIYRADIPKEQLRHRNRDWRAETMAVLEKIPGIGTFIINEKGEAINETGEFILSAIEVPGAYENGKVDVAPTELRIQINTIVPDVLNVHEGVGASAGTLDANIMQEQIAKERKQKLIDLIRTYKKTIGGPDYQIGVQALQSQLEIGELDYKTYLRELQLWQESLGIREEIEIAENISWIDDSNPQKGKCGIYVVPSYSGKQRAMRELITESALKLQLHPNQIKVNYYGDSKPDLDLLSALGDGSTLVLVGGSRLTQPIVHAYEQAQKYREIQAQYEQHIQLLDPTDEQSRKEILQQMYSELSTTKNDFAGEGLSAIGRRLIPAYDEQGEEVQGVFYFVQPERKTKDPVTGEVRKEQNIVRLVLGDKYEAYKGTREVQTMLAYEQQPPNTTYNQADVQRYRRNSNN